MSHTTMNTKRICFWLNGQAIAFQLGLLSENEVRHRIALLRFANVPLDPDVRPFCYPVLIAPGQPGDDVVVCASRR